MAKVQDMMGSEPHRDLHEPTVVAERRSGIDRRRAPEARGRKRLRTLLLAEDSLLMMMLGEALRHAGQYDVVGSADDLATAGEVIAGGEIDLVVVDGDSDTAIADIAALRPTSERTAFVAMLASSDPRAIEPLVEAGADACISKSVSVADIAPVMRHAVRRSVWVRFSLPTPEDTRAPEDAAYALSLTRREMQMLTMVGEGMSNKEIARKVWVTEQTVKFHLSNIYRKLGVSNRTEASRVAYDHGVLSALPAWAPAVTRPTAGHDAPLRAAE